MKNYSNKLLKIEMLLKKAKKENKAKNSTQLYFALDDIKDIINDIMYDLDN